jgi:hypothetical protein
VSCCRGRLWGEKRGRGVKKGFCDWRRKGKEREGKEVGEFFLFSEVLCCVVHGRLMCIYPHISASLVLFGRRVGLVLVHV